jgi:dipeptidyl aminopeptidase/acylaminoacyl peptidase
MSRRGISLAALATLVVLLSAADSVIAAFPGRNGQIAFTTSIGDDLTNDYLDAIDPDGGGLREISLGVGAAYSPNGRRIAFAHPYGRGLRLKRADGRGRERFLTHRSDSGPDWSSDGKRIVFARLYLDDDDEEREQLRIYRKGTSRPLTEGAGPTWSVRGSIAFVRDGGLYAIEPDGSRLRLLIERGDAPDWSPDGRRLAFTDRGFVMTARADGSGVRRLRRGADPAFSPDGHRIAYIGPRGLMIMGSGGRHPHRVPGSDEPDFTGDGSLSGPDWQPLRRAAGPTRMGGVSAPGRT